MIRILILILFSNELQRVHIGLASVFVDALMEEICDLIKSRIQSSRQSSIDFVNNQAHRLVFSLTVAFLKLTKV